MLIKKHFFLFHSLTLKKGHHKVHFSNHEVANSEEDKDRIHHHHVEDNFFLIKATAFLAFAFNFFTALVFLSIKFVQCFFPLFFKFKQISKRFLKTFLFQVKCFKDAHRRKTNNQQRSKPLLGSMNTSQQTFRSNENKETRIIARSFFFFWFYILLGLKQWV